MPFSARTDLARGAAVVFLAADAAALVCVPLILLSERTLIPIPQIAFHGARWLACAIAFVGASAFLWLRRGRQRSFDVVPHTPHRFEEGLVIRVLAWSTVVLAGAWLAFVAVAVAAMMLYYDGSY